MFLKPKRGLRAAWGKMEMISFESQKEDKRKCERGRKQGKAAEPIQFARVKQEEEYK
jgi:hypothetical protein